MQGGLVWQLGLGEDQGGDLGPGEKGAGPVESVGGWPGWLGLAWLAWLAGLGWKSSNFI